MPRHTGRLRIGTSGYHYDHWRGCFYPPRMPKSRWLSCYRERFDTVEINNTFYHLPPARTFDSWRAAVGDDFRFALKFSRYATHLKKLKDPAASIAAFLDRAERLGEKLGPILVQLPPNWKPDPTRLAAFLQAAAPSGHRWAVEMRNRDWLREDIFAILRDAGAALCIHDLIDRHPLAVTAGWLYLRFHGTCPGGKYTRGALADWAGRIRQWLSDGLDVWAYFNNDAGGHAPADAAELRRLVLGR